MELYKKKIIIFSNYDWTIYKFRKNLIDKLSKKYDIIIITKKTEGNYLNDINYEIIYIDYDIYNLGILGNLKLFLKIFKLYKNIRPFCCLHFTNKPNIIGGTVARILSINYINNIAWGGSDTLNIFIKNLLLFLHMISSKKANKVFFQNKDDFKLFKNKNIIDRNYDILPGSGIDLKAVSEYKINYQHNKDNFNTKFIMVSRLIKNKGIVEFLQASRLINNKYKNIQFFLLGDILENNLFLTKKELNNYKYIKYLGYQDNIYKYLSNSDCIILPSYREGVPRTLIEAAAIGLPIITTDVPGCREVCQDNVNGYLCKSKDYNDLYKKIELYILQNYETKKKFSINSLKIAQKFDEKYVIDKYKDTINNLAS